ncbi:MAG: heme exporter protein CcmD [Chromatiales bacterium]|nr:heme exporter protein CcmD [Chromatiales bacterium]
MMEWFLMGGYAWFVWPSYAICLLILLWCAISPYYRHKRSMDALKPAVRHR